MRNNGAALYYAADKLKRDMEIALTAVSREGEGALPYVDSRLRYGPDIKRALALGRPGSPPLKPGELLDPHASSPPPRSGSTGTATSGRPSSRHSRHSHDDTPGSRSRAMSRASPSRRPTMQQ